MKKDRPAWILFFYIIVITIAVMWLGVANYKLNKENRDLRWEIEDWKLCTLDVIECDYEKPTRSVTTASWYDYVITGIEWSKDNRTVASREFERGTMLRVINVANGKTVDVLVNDYGPDESIHPDRGLDLSSYAFSQIADLSDGTVEVEYIVIGQGNYEPVAPK